MPPCQCALAHQYAAGMCIQPVQACACMCSLCRHMQAACAGMCRHGQAWTGMCRYVYAACADMRLPCIRAHWRLNDTHNATWRISLLTMPPGACLCCNPISLARCRVMHGLAAAHKCSGVGDSTATSGGCWLCCRGAQVVHPAWGQWGGKRKQTNENKTKTY